MQPGHIERIKTIMKRRAFLKSLGVFTALIAARPALSLVQSQSPAKTMPPEPGVKTIVALAGARKGASEPEVKAAVRAAANAVTDFSWLSKGDAVFIKPALNSGLAYPSTTSPVAIGAMIELLKQKGAGRVIVGDMSGIEHVKLTPDGLTGSTRRLMASSGMAKAVAAEGGTIALVQEGDLIAIDIPKKKLTLKVATEELKRRKKALKPWTPRISTGYLARYAKLVTSASTGAVFKDWQGDG